MSCEQLIHPFQTDPGVSQDDRVLRSLAEEPVKIDGRNLAGLLDFFRQFSRHVVYHDSRLNTSDWQDFFRKSIPFTIADMVNHDHGSISSGLDFYRELFRRSPSPSGLQLVIHYIFQHTLRITQGWWLILEDSGHPLRNRLEYIIRNQLSTPLRELVRLSYRASRQFTIKNPDFNDFFGTPAWGLSGNDKKLEEELHPVKDPCTEITDLFGEIAGLFPALDQALKMISSEAESHLEYSIYPWMEQFRSLLLTTGQEHQPVRHAPHLGLLFAFLALFRELQDDLNNFSRRHLDFFYQRVLQIIPAPERPDKAHILFTIQKHLKSYLLKKGIEVKGPKDQNKQDIRFALENEIVVNQTTVAGKRTLFLNHKENRGDRIVEGMYMAPDATMADGVEKELKGEHPSWPSLGAKFSKYELPESGKLKPYPDARIGFLLSSPVLFLMEGRRTVRIDLTWEWNELCGENEFYTKDELKTNLGGLFRTVYRIPADILDMTAGMALSDPALSALKEMIGYREAGDPCCHPEQYLKDVWVCSDRYLDLITDPKDRTLMAGVIRAEPPFRISFTGEKGWIAPDSQVVIDAGPDQHLVLECTIGAEQPGIGFYDKKLHGEDIPVAYSAVKLELNPDARISLSCLEGNGFTGAEKDCCLENPGEKSDHYISIYHFLRNLTLTGARIDVEVCGLRNFIVQNDESVQDVNRPVYPFGTRPDVIDFTVIDHGQAGGGGGAGKNLTGPNFYIGSKEIFCKNWNQARINLNWKDKPSDFRDYYKAYVQDGVDQQGNQVFGLDSGKFRIRIARLQGGNWIEEAGNPRKLFDVSPAETFTLHPGTPQEREICDHGGTYEQSILVSSSDFQSQDFCIDRGQLAPLGVSTREGFLRINLRDQDFLHKDYSFVLARQMMALGKYPDFIMEGAIYQKEGNSLLAFKGITDLYRDLIIAINAAVSDATTASEDAGLLDNEYLNNVLTSLIPQPFPFFSPQVVNGLKPFVEAIAGTNNTTGSALNTFLSVTGLDNIIDVIRDKLGILDEDGNFIKDLTVLIPNEPWTPIIRNMSIDYTATARSDDIDLVHLHPYHNTYQEVNLLSSRLFPSFCDEGTLFLGLKNLNPGSMVHMLFQLAETTGDPETEREEVSWHYLENNRWKALRPGFEIVNDATGDLTTPGIIRLSIPENITDANTIMPAGLHWIKASVPENSRAISETIGIHTRAALATFVPGPENDLSRLTNPLEQESLSRLLTADSNIAKVLQPYASFEGQLPEGEGPYYTRVSELLRHKDRAIQKWDYERLCLEAFQEVFRAKCINHSFVMNANLTFNDYPVAPGYVILAVVPDIRKVQGEVVTEPRVPGSLLLRIEEFIRSRTSPFVRMRVMNPRYEKVNICLTVKLKPGKDENYYTELMKEELSAFIAPWTTGAYDRLVFGKPVYRADVLDFLENREYVDYILDLRLFHGSQDAPLPGTIQVMPVTPRSVLVPGHISICIPDGECEDWLNQDGEYTEPCQHKEIL